jgi:hypothetical protein
MSLRGLALPHEHRDFVSGERVLVPLAVEAPPEAISCLLEDFIDARRLLRRNERSSQ